MQEPAGARDAQDRAFGDGGGSLGADGLMARRVERLAGRIDFDQALAGENAAELTDGPAEAFGDGAAVGLGRGGLQAERERIEGGQQVFEQAGGRILAELLALALVATLLVLLVGVATEHRVLETRDLALEFGEAHGRIGGVRSGFGGGFGHKIISLRGRGGAFSRGRGRTSVRAGGGGPSGGPAGPRGRRPWRRSSGR